MPRPTATIVRLFVMIGVLVAPFLPEISSLPLVATLEPSVALAGTQTA